MVTKYQAQSTLHNNTLRALRNKGDAKVFKTVIKQANAIADAAEHTGKRTLKQKYGYSGFADDYFALAGEVLNSLE